MPTDLDEKITNPLPGFEVHAICVNRMIEQGAPYASADSACTIMSTVLKSNGMEAEPNMHIVRAVFTREGVHNRHLKPWSAIKESAKTMLGVPLMINQPSEHVNGEWPPFEDKDRWHGLVVQVNVNEAKKQLDGLIGVFTPDYMRKQGMSNARIKFQEAFLQAIKVGGKFPISVSYGARLSATPGIFQGSNYEAVETYLEHNSVSIVPRGAERVAVMNVHEDDEDSAGAEVAESNVALNTPYGESAMPMDAAAKDLIRTTSLRELTDLNAEVRAVANARDTAEQKVRDLTAERDILARSNSAMEKDAKAARTILARANHGLPDDAGLPDVAEKVTAEFTSKSNALQTHLDADRKAQEKRILTAKKALSNAYKPEDLAVFEDPKDLKSTANRLEALARTHGPRHIVPGDILDANANAGEDGDEDFEDTSGPTKSFSNMEEAFGHKPGTAVRKGGEP